MRTAISELIKPAYPIFNAESVIAEVVIVDTPADICCRLIADANVVLLGCSQISLSVGVAAKDEPDILISYSPSSVAI